LRTATNNSGTIATNPYSSTMATSSLSNPPPTSRPAAAGVATTAASHNNASDGSSIARSMSFEELRNLLTQLVQNRPLYESYYQQRKAFQVDLLQKGGRMYFNIDKEKQPGSKKKKQYIFQIHATFGVKSSNDLLLSCKLPSPLIEPYFEKSPADLRALSRADRQASNQIVDIGGQRVKQAYFESMRTWKATLYPSPDQVFGGASTTNNGTTTNFELQDVMNPILVLEPVS
jgi:hypothetical protein